LECHSVVWFTAADSIGMVMNYQIRALYRQKSDMSGLGWVIYYSTE